MNDSPGLAGINRMFMSSIFRAHRRNMFAYELKYLSMSSLSKVMYDDLEWTVQVRSRSMRVRLCLKIENVS